MSNGELKREKQPVEIKLSDAERVEAAEMVSETIKPTISAGQVEEAPSLYPNLPAAAVQPPIVQKDELTAEVEEVLQEDLGEMYGSLPEAKRQEFKKEGEKLAGLLTRMIRHGKIHGRAVLRLIVHWLKIIPGVNRFFLEQEAKIKTDKILLISDEKKQK